MSLNWTTGYLEMGGFIHTANDPVFAVDTKGGDVFPAAAGNY